jgi:hypothetical protein
MRWIAITLLLINLVTGFLLVRLWRENNQWKDTTWLMAGLVGAQQADITSAKRTWRVYEPVPDGRSEFANRYDGPFEVWHSGYWTGLGWPGRFAEERWTQVHNEYVRARYEGWKNAHHQSTRPISGAP